MTPVHLPPCPRWDLSILHAPRVRRLRPLAPGESPPAPVIPRDRSRPLLHPIPSPPPAPPLLSPVSPGAASTPPAAPPPIVPSTPHPATAHSIPPLARR
ncbi:unnamed protein product [Dicrocoelium dendriticum]|nr:unnamed protein product [Dicrocoelium dendriticum]